MHSKVKAEVSVEHKQVIQSVVVGNNQTSIIPKVPLVENGRLVEEMAGIMNQDIERDGEVPEERVIRWSAIMLLGHIHKHRNLI